MAALQVPYIQGYNALRAQRRAELAKLQRQAGDRNPWARLILSFFFVLFGSVFSMIFLPLGGVFVLVGIISFFSGVKLIGVHRQVKIVMAEENAKWNIRDRALEKLGDSGFETLAKSIEANGSYESLSGWLGRKELDEAEINTLILAAASAGEERSKMQVSEDMKARAGAGRASAKERSDAQFAKAFGQESKSDAFETRSEDAPETSSDEGLHAALLAEEKQSGAALPPKRRREEDDPELDDIRQRVADAQRRRRQ